MEEEWVHVDGYPEYMVSNHGRVRHARIGRETHLFPNRTGRLRVMLSVNDEHPFFYVDELVASHFIDGYREGDRIEHLDGDISNNAAWNLRPILKERWYVIPDAPRYEINLSGDVRNRRTHRILAVNSNGAVTLRDAGETIQRSVNKLLKNALKT